MEESSVQPLTLEKSSGIYLQLYMEESSVKIPRSLEDPETFSGSWLKESSLQPSTLEESSLKSSTLEESLAKFGRIFS